MIMKSLSAVLLMAMAMTVSCYHIDIERRDIDYLALPIAPDTVATLISQSRKLHKGKADPSEFPKLAANMLRSVYTSAGYNFLILEGNIKVNYGCSPVGNPTTTKTLVELLYHYRGSAWRVAIFPTPCQLELHYGACRNCAGSVKLQDKIPSILPCTNVPYKDGKIPHNLITCSGLPLSAENLTDVIHQSKNLGSGHADRDEFAKYAGNMLHGVFASSGYNYLLTRSPTGIAIPKEKYVPDPVSGKPIEVGCNNPVGDPTTTKQFVFTNYTYKGVAWSAAIFPGPCIVRHHDSPLHQSASEDFCHKCGPDFRYQDKYPIPQDPCKDTPSGNDPGSRGWTLNCPDKST